LGKALLPEIGPEIAPSGIDPGDLIVLAGAPSVCPKISTAGGKYPQWARTHAEYPLPDDSARPILGLCSSKNAVDKMDVATLYWFLAPTLQTDQLLGETAIFLALCHGESFSFGNSCYVVVDVHCLCSIAIQ
jgi:hypothetical protein